MIYCLCADLLKPGERELDINNKIFELTASRFGTRKHWHKRLVRTGENTIHPIFVDTPDRVLLEDDIAFIDLGPVFGSLEADFARTYVIGERLSHKADLTKQLSYAQDPCLHKQGKSLRRHHYASGSLHKLFPERSARVVHVRYVVIHEFPGCRR